MTKTERPNNRSSVILSDTRALEKDISYYRSFLESLTDWVWEMDVNGFHTYSNPAVKDILGYDVHDVVGKRTTKFWMDSSKQNHEFLAVLERDLAEGKGWKNFEGHFRHRNGSRVITESTAIPIFDGNGTLTGYRGIDRDITERTQNDAELKRLNEELETAISNLTAADETKDRFISILSHDLGTPIAVVMGYVDMFLHGALGDLTERQKEKIQRMHNAMIRIDKLRRDTLDLSRMGLGTLKLETEPVLIEHLVTEAVEEIMLLVREKNLSITIDLPDMDPVECDPGRMMQVLSNYLSNAIRYTDHGGSIVVDCGDDGNCFENELIIRVKDTGRGIPSDALERVFEPFYQTGSPAQGSTGLGLAIVRGIMTAHGGRAWCESDGEGKGSSFFFALQC